MSTWYTQGYSMTHVLYHWLNYLEAFWSDSFTLKKNVIEKKNCKTTGFSA